MELPKELENQLNQEIKQLRDYIETKKVSLDEEIEENLHLAISNAKDSFELIQENIEPKIEKFIQKKLEKIENKMNNWQKENTFTLQEEIEKKIEPLTERVLKNLESVIDQKTASIKTKATMEIQEEMKNFNRENLAKVSKQTIQIKVVALTAFIISIIAIILSFL